ncbi:farnesyl diphosphate synthase [Stomatobaculum longum]|uniref:polyprenyl synthetase family protein n=1 Tax=Stomatobaculum longum TaxID=796942 RepID=UPI0028053AFB|nr:farnesyl diphosphate synthase [Stomatobaculum longum]
MPTLPYDKTEIETLIRAALPCEEGLQRTVIRAMREAVENGGKRIRPILLFETCKSFAERRGETGWKEEAAPFLTALEMIHSFSLVHDDLPCMDNDTLRRGKPTTWYVYGEAMGTLAGDGLVLEALTVAGRAVGQSRHPERAARALAILGEKSGVCGMLGGQSVDVEKTGERLDATTLDFIYRLKTGALLEAAFMMGAALGGASEAEISCAEQIGRAVGLAFQIQDDILDETAAEAELGKPLHSDEKNQKTTYVSLFGLEAAREAVRQQSEAAEQRLREFPGETETLAALIAYLTDRRF